MSKSNNICYKLYDYLNRSFLKFLWKELKIMKKFKIKFVFLGIYIFLHFKLRLIEK
jgi:hypothetical protein